MKTFLLSLHMIKKGQTRSWVELLKLSGWLQVKEQLAWLKLPLILSSCIWFWGIIATTARGYMHVCAGGDLFMSVPTGFGKSLCYTQLFSHYCLLGGEGSIALCISPLTLLLCSLVLPHPLYNGKGLVQIQARGTQCCLDAYCHNDDL